MGRIFKESGEPFEWTFKIEEFYFPIKFVDPFDPAPKLDYSQSFNIPFSVAPEISEYEDFTRVIYRSDPTKEPDIHAYFILSIEKIKNGKATCRISLDTSIDDRLTKTLPVWDGVNDGYLIVAQNDYSIFGELWSYTLSYDKNDKRIIIPYYTFNLKLTNDTLNSIPFRVYANGWDGYNGTPPFTYECKKNLPKITFLQLVVICARLIDRAIILDISELGKINIVCTRIDFTPSELTFSDLELSKKTKDGKNISFKYGEKSIITYHSKNSLAPENAELETINAVYFEYYIDLISFSDLMQKPATAPKEGQLILISNENGYAESPLKYILNTQDLKRNFSINEYYYMLSEARDFTAVSKVKPNSICSYLGNKIAFIKSITYNKQKNNWLITGRLTKQLPKDSKTIRGNSTFVWTWDNYDQGFPLLADNLTAEDIKNINNKLKAANRPFSLSEAGLFTYTGRRVMDPYTFNAHYTFSFYNQTIKLMFSSPSRGSVLYTYELVDSRAEIETSSRLISFTYTVTAGDYANLLDEALFNTVVEVFSSEGNTMGAQIVGQRATPTSTHYNSAVIYISPLYSPSKVVLSMGPSFPSKVTFHPTISIWTL